MNWVVGAMVLVAVGVVLRRLLRMNSSGERSLAGVTTLAPELNAIYHPLEQELKTYGDMLGISLNEAFQERREGREETAWQQVQLSAGEWDRLEELVQTLQNGLAKYLPSAQVLVPARRIQAGYYKSHVMVDFIRMHELLDNLVFRSRLRFQLHVRLLRRATEILSKEFRRTYRYLERTQDQSLEVWARLDFYFHDFDLITKETLLAFRTLLLCLPPEVLPQVAAEVHVLVEHGVRVPVGSMNP